MFDCLSRRQKHSSDACIENQHITSNMATSTWIATNSSSGRAVSGDYENYKQEEDKIIKYSDYRGSISSSSNSSEASNPEVLLEDGNDAISRVTLTKQEKVKTTKKSFRGGAQKSAKGSSFDLFSHRE
jgi:hypothetical protein